MKRVLMVGKIIARTPVYTNPAHAMQHFATPVSTLKRPDGNAILDAIADILYPVDGSPDDQWNGGDVCDDLNRLLLKYRPDAPARQKGDDQ